MEKVVKQLSKIYPEIEWSLAEPNDDILENFGNGIVLVGERGAKVKDFFILSDDPRKLQWGHVIANYLNGTVVHEGEE